MTCRSNLCGALNVMVDSLIRFPLFSGLWKAQHPDRVYLP
jgi:hypothetical protein